MGHGDKAGVLSTMRKVEPSIYYPRKPRWHPNRLSCDNVGVETSRLSGKAHEV